MTPRITQYVLAYDIFANEHIGSGRGTFPFFQVCHVPVNLQGWFGITYTF